MRRPGEVHVESKVVAEIGKRGRSREECSDMSPGCNRCCGKRLRAVLKHEPKSIMTDHMTIPEMDFLV